ncbi:thermonuclease family protein [Candidatus Kaiserbacteria bacterium]|nr:thermonuclease family protein [Candidatus Kaiserbacteria bacterium]
MRKGLYVIAGICFALALAAAGAGAVRVADYAITPVATDSPQAATTTATSRTPEAAPDTYPVVEVVDGDTIDVHMNGETTRLRLVGMDTPEVVDPRKVVQCFGKEASAEGHRLLEGQWVRLEYDAVAGTFDKYGRTLAYVFRADGLFYNEYMIANGFAHEYTYSGQKYTYQAQFKAAQKAAEEALLGFWSPSACGGNTTKPAAST